MADDDLRARFGDACRKAGIAAEGGGWRIALAESCTGGLIAAGLTGIAGASGWFSLGVVCYSDGVKIDTLGVPRAVIEGEGAVSEAAVSCLCDGVLALLPEKGGRCLAVAVSGVAGPGGGSVEKPVGTCCFGWKIGGGDVVVETAVFDGDREAIRLQAAVYALEKAVAIMSSAGNN